MPLRLEKRGLDRVVRQTHQHSHDETDLTLIPALIVAMRNHFLNRGYPCPQIDNQGIKVERLGLALTIGRDRDRMSQRRIKIP